MTFGLYYEDQPRQPSAQDSELRVHQQALKRVELADRLSASYWEIEDHFPREYSRSIPTQDPVNGAA